MTERVAVRSWCFAAALLLAVGSGADARADGFTPKDVSVESLRYTGTRFTPKDVSVESLRYTGTRFTPKDVSVESLRYTGTRFEFTPKDVSAETLRYVGTRLELAPKDVMIERLHWTGAPRRLERSLSPTPGRSLQKVDEPAGASGRLSTPTPKRQPVRSRVRTVD